jgi:hypothetical protein
VARDGGTNTVDRSVSAELALGTGSALAVAMTHAPAGLAAGTGLANDATVPGPDPFNLAVQADSPYVWWDTRLASGGAQPDSSGNVRVGTITGSPSVSADGLTFNNTTTGDDQYIQSNATIVSGTSFAHWTFEIVAEASTWTVSSVIFDTDDPTAATQNGWFVGPGPTGHIYAAGGFVAQSTISILAASTLTHLVATYDGTTAKLFYNGRQEVALATALGGISLSANANFMLADDLQGAGDGFNGLVRHGIFYAQALPVDRVGAHYSAMDPFNTEVDADSPYVWWDTRLAASGVQPDSSGNGHTGTVTGSPSVSADGLIFDNSTTGDDQYILGDDTYAGTPGTYAFEIVLAMNSALENSAAYVIPACWDALPAGVDTTGWDIQTASPQAIYYDGTSGQAQGVLLTIGDGDNVLHHLVAEYDGTHFVTYLDGVQKISTTMSPGLNFTRAMTFVVGDDMHGSGHGYGGLVRHAAFYEHSLGPTRVTAHWDAL